mmetsp:Transcript_38807/g.50225  ORF Transcript_38807/g.50225 Transcript_38807/m.50225 type:complete len:580 (+) Transcript_38807:83-1822(+)
MVIIQPGMKVEARYKDSKRYFLGTVVRHNPDSTFAINFDLGSDSNKSEVINVERNDMRLPDSTKDEFEISHLIFDGPINKLKNNIKVAKKKGKKMNMLLSRSDLKPKYAPRDTIAAAQKNFGVQSTNNNNNIDSSDNDNNNNENKKNRLSVIDAASSSVVSNLMQQWPKDNYMINNNKLNEIAEEDDLISITSNTSPLRLALRGTLGSYDKKYNIHHSNHHHSSCNSSISSTYSMNTNQSCIANNEKKEKKDNVFQTQTEESDILESTFTSNQLYQNNIKNNHNDDDVDEIATVGTDISSYHSYHNNNNDHHGTTTTRDDDNYSLDSFDSLDSEILTNSHQRDQGQHVNHFIKTNHIINDSYRNNSSDNVSVLSSNQSHYSDVSSCPTYRSTASSLSTLNELIQYSNAITSFHHNYHDSNTMNNDDLASMKNLNNNSKNNGMNDDDDDVSLRKSRVSRPTDPSLLRRPGVLTCARSAVAASRLSDNSPIARTRAMKNRKLKLLGDIQPFDPSSSSSSSSIDSSSSSIDNISSHNNHNHITNKRNSGSSLISQKNPKSGGSTSRLFNMGDGQEGFAINNT